MRQIAASLPSARLISASALPAFPQPAPTSGSASHRRMRNRSSGVAGRRVMVARLSTLATYSTLILSLSKDGPRAQPCGSTSSPRGLRDCPSMPEVAHAGEDHGEAFLVGGLDHLLVLHGTARLNDRYRAGFRRHQQTVGERK